MTKSNYSRREFLERSAGIAGGSLVGGSILLEPDPLVALPRLSLDSHEELPGPIYLQGSEKGHVAYCSIVITPAQK
jgi:hypothetical protein